MEGQDMTDYTELVKALRDIEKTMFALGTSPINMGDVSISLAYDKRWGQTAEAAAAAIEALLKENKELIEDHPEMVEADGHWEWRKPNGEAQLPKRGKWIGVSPMVDTVQCSVCGGQLFSAELETPYCPYCGAKMEVQDGQE